MAMEIYQQEEDKSLIANSMDEVENVSFRECMVSFHTKSIYNVLSEMVRHYLGFVTSYDSNYIMQKAKEFANQNFDSFAHKEIPTCFTEILEKPMKKKEQIKLLKGANLTYDQLGALFAQAENKGYSFSHYHYQGDPSSVNKDELPKFIHVKEDGTVEYYGKTTLTEGQIKQVVEQADVLIARILDNDEHWHCFLQTFKGLKGQEAGLQGSQPHLHYISDSFGISRNSLVEMLRKGEYPSTPVHIPLKENEEKVE